MKVRWMSGSLRLRISPEEFDKLLSGSRVVENLCAPGKGEWTAICAIGERSDIVIDGGLLTFTIGRADMERFRQEEVEGLYFNSDTDPRFRYYIEKNFPCAHPHALEAAAMDPPMGTFAPTRAFEDRKRKKNCE